MKHAFIFGTNLYLTERKTVTFTAHDHTTEILKVVSFYSPREHSNLVIDANFSLPNHPDIRISNNELNAGSHFNLSVEPNRVRLYHADHAEPVFDVYELDEHEYAGLSSFITNEFAVQYPDHTLTIKGNFYAGDANVVIDNEKMWINEDSYANGVENAQDGIKLRVEEVGTEYSGIKPYEA